MSQTILVNISTKVAASELIFKKYIYIFFDIYICDIEIIKEVPHDCLRVNDT